MKALIVSLFFGCVFVTSQAQKPPVKFGDVSREELQMTSYPNDSTAPAVILADYGTSAILYRQNIGFSLDFERITRIKILTKEGLTWGDFTIPLYKNTTEEEKLVGLKAITYNLENGKIVESKLKNDAMFRENETANRDLIKLTCPNVREGSVVEITYKINSPFLFNFQDWSFQTTIPTITSEYRAQIPEYFYYDKYMQGYVALDVSDETRESNAIRLTSFERSAGRGFSNVQSQATTDQIDYQDVKHRWVANNVPAFKPEPYMTSIVDYMTKINFELASIKYPDEPIKQIMGSWQDINKTMAESENFGGEITGNGFLKKTVEELTAGKVSAEELIVAITNYVKENVAWNGNSGIFTSSSLRKILENKKGNSADVNLLLGSMLEKAGISVRPVLVSTRSNGLLRVSTPVMSQFNYVICVAKANDKSYLLDATERLLPLGMLPERCLNGQGFAVAKEGFQWLPLESKYKTRIVTTGDFAINSNGELEGTLKLDCNGYEALKNRKKYLVDGEAEYVKDFVGSHAWNIKSSEIKNAKEIHNNFVGIHNVVINENMVQAGDVLYLDPFIYSRQKENPFKSEKREYPVDFGSPMEETILFKIAIPEGYVVDELPQSKVIAMPENGARYVYNITQSGNQIAFTSMFHINKSLFTQLEYPYLREFYNQIVAKQAEQIVLKKK